MLFAEQRRSLALFICPEIARAIRSDEREMLVEAGFFDEYEAIAHGRARQAWSDAERAKVVDRLKEQYPACGAVAATSEVWQSTPAALESIQHQEGLPTHHVYQAAIPEGWRALWPVLYPIPAAPDAPARQGMPAAILKGMARFRAGILLCRQGEDGREAAQEFQADASPEAAFLSQDGQYLQASPSRPAYGVMPLAAPNPTCLGQSKRAECLVLLPLLDPCPTAPRESLPPIMMFVDGACVYRSDNLGVQE